MQWRHGGTVSKAFALAYVGVHVASKFNKTISPFVGEGQHKRRCQCTYWEPTEVCIRFRVLLLRKSWQHRVLVRRCIVFSSGLVGVFFSRRTFASLPHFLSITPQGPYRSTLSRSSTSSRWELLLFEDWIQEQEQESVRKC